MEIIKGKHIVIGVTASIAAYKIPLLIRLLVKEGAEVQVVMTPSARDFVTPLTLSTLSKLPVLSEPFNPLDGSWNSHVELGQWADLLLIAPASANTLAKMANGIADNFLLTVYLSAKCPVLFAPAMDLDMFRHPTTQANVKQLLEFGHRLIEPQVGELASGLCGAGRMEEPEVMLEILRTELYPKDLVGKSALVTAGPTIEAIDPVRFLGNHSSGQMGFALAEELARRGARVSLISGPVNVKTDVQGIKLTHVKSAADMLSACLNEPPHDIIIMAAAVADYTPASFSDIKIKKSDAPLTLSLAPTQDILSALSAKRIDNQVIVGFALETDNAIENARKKLHTKNLDMVVLNSLRDEGAGFAFSTNVITILAKDGEEQIFPIMPKTEAAMHIVNKISQMTKIIE